MTSQLNGLTHEGKRWLSKPAGRDHHAVKAFTVHLPGRPYGPDAGSEANPVDQAKFSNVSLRIRVHRLCSGMQRMVSCGMKLRERGHRATRVRKHSRPNGAVLCHWPPTSSLAAKTVVSNLASGARVAAAVLPGPPDNRALPVL